MIRSVYFSLALLIAVGTSADAFVVQGGALGLLRGGGSVSRTVNLRCSASPAADLEALNAKIDTSKSNAKGNVPYSDAELDGVISSFQAAGGGECSKDWKAVRELLSNSAHKKHTEWGTTEQAGEKLAGLLSGPGDAEFRRIFSRVLKDGNWDQAAKAGSLRPGTSKPWAVLVTGVNGIRKTSTIYQPWFKEVLAEALAAQFPGSQDELPTGSNSFFRQLDYIIATVAIFEFEKLYEIDEIGTYASFKDGIFARYRTLAEMVGALLVKEARNRKMNVMVETSGRDIGMFKYVDHFFPDEEYNKLVVHFTINDIAFAENSVDTRMVKEMSDGQKALASGNTEKVIQANAGGPYGSQVLKQVEKESNAVWARLQTEEETVAKTWYKASLRVTASDSTAWTVRAAANAAGPDADFKFTPLK
mmetsp:Transcript_23306/g.55478  ORF Transcript_23306/g.55478 Transcript_23306/m.55478 type:complete len:418 (+) Transcript_23306:53-1306(+)